MQTTAFIITFRRPSSARLWRVKASSTTGTADFMKDRFEAAPARPFVTEISAIVISALKRLPALSSAEMFGFDFAY